MGIGRPKSALNLTAEERADLAAIVASRSLPHGLVRRANMILLTESGMSVRATARRVKVTPAAVSNWRKRFRKQRLAGLHDRGRIAPGLRADLLQVRLFENMPVIRAVWRQGVRIG